MDNELAQEAVMNTLRNDSDDIDEIAQALIESLLLNNVEQEVGIA